MGRIGRLLNFRLPEMLFKIDNLMVFDDFNSFAFEQLLHEIGAVEMMLSGEQSVAVDDAVCRNIFHIYADAFMAQPTIRAERPGTDGFGDSAIRSDFPIRNLSCYGINFFEEIGFHH